MKKLMKAVSLLLAIVMVLNLAACAPGSDQTAAVKAETAQEATTETESEVKESETEAAKAEGIEADKADETEAGKAEDSADESDNDLVILYTNDTHGYINNYTKTDEDGHPGLSFASVAAMKQDLINEGETVLLVDAGDHIQGTVYNAVDQGRSIIYLMNLSGYDLSTIGNHEFDYNCFRMLSATTKAWYPYVCCNLYEVNDGLPLFQAYQEFNTKSGKKVAIIGIGTPESVTTPVRFEDDQGNYYLDFYGRQDKNDLYMAVQTSINLAKYYGADYVIALGHLGVDASSEGHRSEDVIKHVTGLDAFIDGHSHTEMEKKMVEDASGKKIPLTQTGCNFNAIGKMTLKKDGSIDTELIKTYDKYNITIRELEKRWAKTVEMEMNDKIASIDYNLIINNPDKPENRIVRLQETNLGDLCADAVYSFYNEQKNIDCDLTIINGGGVRAEIPAGDINYLSCKSVHPFGNIVCVIEVTGQQILDMLEWSMCQLGLMDEETGDPAECGNFIHCAGMRYTVDTTVKDTVQRDDNGDWGGAPTGEYRVRDVSIYNRETEKYEPLDLEKTYKLGGQNYLLRSLGGGLNMLKDSKVVEDFSGEDYMIFAEYLTSFEKDDKGEIKITSENSPLSSYEGYDLNYENPYGAGRITIIK